ncbi:SPFH domain-containing protein [Rhodoligotrophos ferricapiens]|uniref:SPFH domain-containing protein n=1 Tax=Rhodoligotrophos ferricapiens TaxID=3069264 RepID=UPI00315D633F
MFEGLSIFVVVLLVVVLLAIFQGIRVIPQGSNWTVERFGRYTKTLQPGLNLIVPFIDRIGAKLNMMEQVLDIPSQEVITRDNAMVEVNGVAFYQVLDAAKAAYEVSGLENAIVNLTLTNIRTVMGSMDLDELLSKRDEINQRLITVVDQATHPWGVKVTRIEIRDINPPRDLVDSMARQMKAEREKRARILEAEGVRAAEILRAEGQKQATVLEAEGRKEAAFRDAEARERAAEAEAKATQMVSDAIATGNIQAINYFVATKYVDALSELASAPNQKVLMMPVDATSILGAVGGIAELTRAAFGGDGDGRPAPRGGQRPVGTGAEASAPRRRSTGAVPQVSSPMQGGPTTPSSGPATE